jgi:uncharacterized damage-inducible protein DinB
MIDFENQILESWRAHNRIMLFLLDHIPDEGLNATLSARGGRGIGGQFAHIHMIRFWKLDAICRPLSKNLVQFGKDQKEPTKETLLNALIQSGEAVEKYLQYSMENDAKIKHFKYRTVPVLSYFISHEAHHRGNMLLTLKKSGFKMSDPLRWGIWDWNKFQDAAPQNADGDMEDFPEE